MLPQEYNRSKGFWFARAASDYLATLITLFAVTLGCRLLTYIWLEGWQLPDAPGTLLIYALRWDAKLFATWGLLLSLLLAPGLLFKKSAALSANAIRLANTGFLLFICVASYLLCVYWQAVGYPFDSFMFGIVHDETKEILALIWQEYKPLQNLLVLLLLCGAALWLKSRLQAPLVRKISRLPLVSPPQQLAFSALLLVVFIGLIALARGSLSLFPLSKKTTHFSHDQMLNDLAINAPNHLYYALKNNDKNALDDPALTHLQEAGYSSPEEAAKDLLFHGDNTAEGTPLLVNSKAQLMGENPNIIFIMMESWSSHILQSDPNLWGSFAKQHNQGALFMQHLSTRLGTSRFIESTLLNSALLDLSISPAQTMRLAHSNIQTLINSGYKAYIVSGGARSWLNHDSFWRSQGVSHYWDMSDIMKRYKVKKHSDWGVHDEYTLAFAQEKAEQLQQQKTPFFLFVITTSNHPPHSVPRHYSKQHSLPPLNPQYFAREHQLKPEQIAQQLATLRYSTDQLGLFLQRLQQSRLHNNSILVATGDHILRGFYQYSNDSERVLAGAVPLYIQAPQQLLQGRQWNTHAPASHRDIFPTLYELAVPNAQYLKTGFNLLDPTEMRGAWYEQDIWLLENEVSFSLPDISYGVDAQLRTNTPAGNSSEAMKRYRRHTQALEALLEWQVRQEFLQFKQARSHNAQSATAK